MQVCVPSTPAQMFHMLRRQILRSLRKPLIVMTPKSLLRHELSVSSLDDLANGEFRHVIDEIDKLDRRRTCTASCCASGKVYFDLLKARRAANNDDVAIVRVEQLYPFPVPEMEAVLAKYPNAARSRVVPGRAAEPGRVVPDPPPARDARGQTRAAVRRPCARRGARDGHQQDPRSRTTRAHRSRVDRDQQRRRGARNEAPDVDARAAQAAAATSR